MTATSDMTNDMTNDEVTMTSNVTPVAEHNLARDLTLYTVGRIALIAVVTVLLVLFKVPLLVAVAVAVVVGFPLGLLVFRGLNHRVTAALAERGEDRMNTRERLRAELRGDQPGRDTDAG
jgi:hypothetical protein